MSKREKNLLSALLLVLIVVGGFLLYNNLYLPRYQKAQRKLTIAEQQIATAEAVGKNEELFKEELDWIERYEPKPVSLQNAQSALQKSCEAQATRNNLEIKKQNYLPAPQTQGPHYHRARIDLVVTGNEKSFYNWVNFLDNAQNFQRVTFLRLYPNKADDTLIEAKVTVEKWFPPAVN